MPDVKVTRVFQENMNATEKVIVNRGGARSSKSYSLMQLFLTRFFGCSDKAFLVTRKTSPAMRLSILKLFYEVCRFDFGIDPETLRKEKQFLNFYYGNNILHFGAIDDPEKIKSTEWSYIWMEEATEFDIEDYRALRLRLSKKVRDGLRNQLFMSFNPVNIFHWIKKEVIDPKKDVLEIISSYKDNPTLDEDYIKELEDLQNQNYNYYRIYALGEWGALEDLIYPQSSWEIVPEDSWPKQFDDTVYGLDFGFTNSETALTQVNFLDDRIFEQEKIYGKGLTNTDLIELLHDVVGSFDAVIYADPASPDRIEELVRAGFNIQPYEKKPGSVISSIDCVKAKKLLIHEKSSNLIREKQSYSFKKDKANNVIDQPVKMNDHLMDAERMAIHQHLGNAEPNVFFI
jgi:phage terminase large subunit